MERLHRQRDMTTCDRTPSATLPLRFVSLADSQHHRLPPPSAAPGAGEHEMVLLTVSERLLSGSGGEAATADGRVPPGKQRGGRGGESASCRRDKGRRGAGVKGRLD